MKIINLWSLHYEKFIIEVEGTAREISTFIDNLNLTFPEKTFLINKREVEE